MKLVGQHAVIIFIDNSAMSIDGDFLPNRLAAQINTVENYAQCLFSENTSLNNSSDEANGNSNMNGFNSFNLDYDNIYDYQERDLFSNDSLIAVGTIGSEEFGIRTSFTSNYMRLQKTLSTITTGGTALLDRAIKLGFMALKHAPPLAQLKMIFFLNSSELTILENTLDDKKVNELNKKILENKKITVNFIVIGENDSLLKFNNVSNMQTVQNYNNTPQNISSNNNPLNIQNLQAIQPNPILQNMVQNQQLCMQSQQIKSVDTSSKKSSRSKKSSSNTNETLSVLQRIIKKAKNASIMIVQTCNTILSDVVMAIELGYQLPPGVQIIHGSATCGSRKRNSANINSCVNINNTNIRNVNNNPAIFDPEHEFDMGYGYNPRFNASNVNINVPDMHIPPIALSSSASIPSSPTAIKKERKAQTIKSIVFTNSNPSDNQNIQIPVVNNQNYEQQKPKQTRGRKPKYIAPFNMDQIVSSNSLPSAENNPSFQQIFNMNYANINMGSNGKRATKEKKPNKIALSTSSSVVFSTPSQVFPIIQTDNMPPIQQAPPIDIENQKKRKEKSAKSNNQESETEKVSDALNTGVKQTRQVKQRKQKKV
ncbi:26S proteasome non-ATPase regulatory subunit 4 [Tritrichomonas musculus]|uniref:26S proteasome non-ATPase regulatory subunit 4 n=1 Tax=Tritrichomonas musculus TaxID=1915356 RepID=A0ABR2K2R3_9EUKA